ncbi:dihydroxyacetone phosphate acyltransferase-like [Dendronephthya gigantea]|uniref:dihydroxyacetone phosphate acyltransferase-like n=1 Tax=Dendronephthya gigantea TaxID=151771 RepID=UPI0010694E0E|nr:dihydroxyacetone phosphate acyltransferase-like [Dendronephthya gigantea]XP_028396265.1 dihydroxyacetone phosphate acyltransferase-like [Dendronephthya gigantea]
MDAFQSVKQCGSDILFSLHDFDPPISPVEDPRSVSGLDGGKIIEYVLESARIRNAVTEIASKQGRSVEDVFAEVKVLLADIGHTFTLKSIRFMAYLLRKVFRNIYSGIKVNMEGLNKVREISKECPVVFVPSHRSYTDFLLVSFVCFIFQLPLPVIAAAQDFKSMKLIGGLLRNCGAFYMKRSFRSDELYWAVFSEYVQCLLLNSGTTMEFFLEGTRSRSGKSLHPKQGLLSIITDVYFTSRVPDIVFCPISISYDRVLEETLMARELLGVPKPKESLKGLLNSRSVLSDDYGYAYMYFGKPISLREFSDGLVNRSQRSCIPRSIRNEATADEMNVVRKLAGHILEKIQENLIVLPNMIVASIILQYPTGIDLELLTRKYESTLEWCKKCDVPIARNENCDLKDDLVQSLQLLKSSVFVTDDDKVCLLETENYPEGFKNKVSALLDARNSLEITRDTEHLNEETMNSEATSLGGPSLLTDLKALNGEEKNYLVHLTCVHLQLAHQRNQLLHWFYIPAMAALVARTCASNISEDYLYKRAKSIGDLVCMEIAKDSFPSQQEFVSGLEKFRELGMFDRRGEFYVVNQTESFHFISRLWKPIITSYWLISCHILNFCEHGKEYQANTLIHNCQEFALELFLKGTVQDLEIQSLELCRNGIKSLRKLEIIKQIKRDSNDMIAISNKSSLYNTTVTLEDILHLKFTRQPSTRSKL